MKVLQQGNALKTLMTAMATILGGVGVMQSAQAATWSDTSIGWRYGTQFAEPYKNDADGSRTDITKQIFNLTHASGDKYGSNFFNV
ncbi:MAG TPA: outer envelope protein, partial [Acinetobacter ursingii]|nr:outer envelope protein [Acinetobacter ursingii]